MDALQVVHSELGTGKRFTCYGPPNNRGGHPVKWSSKRHGQLVLEEDTCNQVAPHMAVS